MPNLIFGQEDITYSQGNEVKTTQEVADKLELMYGIKQKYIELKDQQIADKIANSLAQSLGRSNNVDPYDDACLDIETGFRNFIGSREAEISGIMGLPSYASITGHGRITKTPGPSLIDTGLYVKTVKVWKEV